MQMQQITGQRKLFYPELSYQITGWCFQVQNTVGRFARERQYGNTLEDLLKKNGVEFRREFHIDTSGNIADFIIDRKILLELKAKPFILKDDYYQIQRYLQSARLKLGMIINFRSRYLKPKRVILKDIAD